ncbi:HEXXH motif domain-containing protein [Nocardia tengchongensis]|uniref:HEXXH motif domain-containing protein n=1 Tax=Nocardia tengchongensis TaxID=2055889 RepID=UPI0036B34B3C
MQPAGRRTNARLARTAVARPPEITGVETMPDTGSGTADITTDLGSGHGSVAGIAQLTEGLVEMRMILLRTLISTVAADVAEVAGLHEAYRTLSDLQPDHPDQISSLLCYPHTGPWLSRVLRRAAGQPDDAPPLWADCAYLGWLAAAASITCRTAGTVRVLIRNGAVMLPTLGLARLDSAEYSGSCELSWTASGALYFTWSNGSIRVDSRTDQSHPAWLPLRWVRAADDEPRIWLDDLDPFRTLMPGQPAPPRLNDTQAQQWQRDFADAWQVLRSNLGQYVAPMRACLTTLTPLSAKPLVASASHTAFDGVGCVYTTAPVDPCQLALTLIHEIQHTKFALLTDQVEMFTPDPACRFYAPWRDDPRPIHGLLHGIYAFFGVTDFWRVHRHSECHGSLQAHADFELWRVQVAGAIAQAQESGLLSADGQRLLGSLTAAMTPWSGEDLPDVARHAATDAAIAHRTFWQVRNLEPDRVGIAELVARWDAGRPATDELPPASLIDQHQIPDHHRRLRLAAQLKTINPVAAEKLSDPHQPEGDRPYLAGYLTEAVALYSRELSSDPLRPQAWAGLSLAGQKMFGGTVFGILNERAEVVARLYEALCPDIEIVDLLRWMSRPAPQPRLSMPPAAS